MALSTVTVTWAEDDPTLTSLAGTVTFTLSQLVTDSSTGAQVQPVPQTYPISSGQSLPLVANDSATAVPQGTYYTVVIQPAGGAAYSFMTQLLAAHGASQALGSLAQVVPASPQLTLMPLPSGIPSAGLVPVAVGSGVTSAWGPALGGLDTNAADIQRSGPAALAGAVGKAADAGHVHPSNDYFTGEGLASGETCMPRQNIGGGLVAVSGTVYFTFWTAIKTEACNNIATVVNNTAAGATPTYAAMGVYSVDGSGNLTLLAQCASDTTLFAATFTTYTRSLTTQFSKVSGQRYAFATLTVSSAQMPQFFGHNGTLAMNTVAPRLNGAIAGQASLPASVLAANVANSNAMNFGAVTP